MFSCKQSRKSGITSFKNNTHSTYNRLFINNDIMHCQYTHIHVYTQNCTNTHTIRCDIHMYMYIYNYYTIIHMYVHVHDYNNHCMWPGTWTYSSGTCLHIHVQCTYASCIFQQGGAGKEGRLLAKLNFGSKILQLQN